MHSFIHSSQDGGEIRVGVLFLFADIGYHSLGNRNSWTTANRLDCLSCKERNDKGGMMNG